MDFRDFLIVHLGAAPVEMIDQIRDRLLVAGDEFRRKNHRVAGHDLDRLWSFKATRWSTESGSPWLPVVRNVSWSAGKLMPALALGHETARHTQIAQVGGDLAVANHAPTAEDERPPQRSEISMTCWMRGMLDEKVETSTLPVLCSMICSKLCRLRVPTAYGRCARRWSSPTSTTARPFRRRRRSVGSRTSRHPSACCRS